jgi:cytochrome c7-like protein/class III cytochrome C family protein
MKRLGRLLFDTILVVWVLSGQQNPGPQQPIPFSHKSHRAVGIKCLDCHTIRKPGFEAGLPQEATCMGCHSTVKPDSQTIKKLAEFYKAKKPVPWIKVYTVPDFVWFSHEVHYRGAHLECETCHGAVAEREVIAKEKPTSMNACVECHERYKASTDCGICHDIH